MPTPSFARHALKSTTVQCPFVVAATDDVTVQLELACMLYGVVERRVSFAENFAALAGLANTQPAAGYGFDDGGIR